MGEPVKEELFLEEGIPETTLEPWQREVGGMYRAMRYIHRKARGLESGGLDRWDVLNIHKIATNDPFNPEKTGVLRTVPVKVRARVNNQVIDAAFTPPDAHFLSEFFNEFANEFEAKTSQLSSNTSVAEAIDLAAWAHWRFIEIHPFEDGNGRTARLLVDFIFRKSRLPYLRDWKKGEYNEVVYRIYKEDNLNLLKSFLGICLDERLSEIEDNLTSDYPNITFREYIKERRRETREYMDMVSNRESDLLLASSLSRS